MGVWAGTSIMNAESTIPNLAVIQEVLSEQLDVPREQIVPEATILGDLGADSLDVMEIGMKLEERFEILIPDERWDEVQTVEDLAQTVSRFREGAG